MNNKVFAFFAFFLGVLTTASAQLEKTLHQTFPVGEMNTISLDLHGEYSIEPWAGNNILVETNVLLYNSSSSVLKHFVEKDLRYSIDADTTANGTLHLVSHDKKRVSIRTKTGAESTEVIKVRVFVPEDFVVRDQKLLEREAKQD